jgi:hypothetical protein
VDELAVELVGDAVPGLSPEFLREAALGLLKYFRDELGRDQVTVGEFVEALGVVLRGFGFQFELQAAAAGETHAPEPKARVELALDGMVSHDDPALESGFLPRLRQELQRCLEAAPPLVRVTGLRRCVKRLSGTRRWNRRCQRLRDQIVAYVRLCFAENSSGRDCALVVS